VAVTLVNDRGEVLDGLTAILGREPEDFEVVARFRTAELPEHGSIPGRLIVFDPAGADDPVTVLRALRWGAPEVPIVVLAETDLAATDGDNVHALAPSTPIGELLRALREIAGRPQPT
jgi:hypothetical protein